MAIRTGCLCNSEGPVRVHTLMKLYGKNALRKVVGFLSFTSAAVVLGGCMVGPDYEKPQVLMPDSWHVDLIDGLVSSETQTSGPWWVEFNDPLLVELIGLAERRNLNLRSAVSTIREARAQYGAAAADLYPQVSLGADGDFSTGNQRTLAPTAGAIPGFEYENQAYSLGLDLGWEVDLWGKVRRSMESAEATVQETVENWRDVLVTLRAEVAQSYIVARAYQQQIAALQTTIDSRVASLMLIKERYDVGVATELEVAQAEANLADANAQMPMLVESLAKSFNRLSVLIGEAPGPLRDRLAAIGPIPRANDEIGVGIPADIIRRRPDIRSAERSLAAATANVGVAEAMLYPALKITGSGGFSSTQFSNLIDSSSLGGVLGIEVSWPFFTAGRLEALVEVSDEQAKQALYFYEQTVLNAIEDVENVLIGYVQNIRAREAVARVVTSYRNVVVLSSERYARGVDDLQTLLEAERFLLEAEQNLAMLEGQVASSVVVLYKALGGAWDVVPQGTSGAKTVASEEEPEPEHEQEVSG